jgi:hypothetical protein
MKFKGLFFWNKKKQSPEDKAEAMLALVRKYIPMVREIMRNPEVEFNDVTTDGMIMGRMYDFYRNWNGGSGPVDAMDDFINTDATNSDKVMMEDPRKVATFTLLGLDEKIQGLKDKQKLLSNRYAGDQIRGLCKRLENRKKYNDHMEFFLQFPNTTDEKIQKLLDNYKLVVKTSDLFVPTFPADAVDVMQKYIEVCQLICDETPVFYVIAEEKDFVKKEEKLDPILLVQSPFGFYWQILGAWDKEMLLLSEL